MSVLNLKEYIKFRIEVNRELKNVEVDDNFRYVANPWSDKRIYKKGMIVYYEKDISDSGSTVPVYALYWYVANRVTTKGIFIESEWDDIGSGNAADDGSGIINVTRAYSDILVNSTASGTFSSSNNGLIPSLGEDVISFLKSGGITLEHDINDKLIRIGTSLTPSLDGSFILTIAGETVDLSPISGGSWTLTGTTIHPINNAHKLAVGVNTATATLDINGNIRVRSVVDNTTTNDVAIINNNNIIDKREINAGVWNITGSFITGGGIEGYLSKWDATGITLEDSIIFEDSVNNRLAIGHANPVEVLDVGGAIKLGSASNDSVGSMRWDGSDFMGRLSAGWVSLTTATVDEEQIQDIVGAMFTGNNEVGLQLDYSDSSGVINASVDQFTINLTGDAIGSVFVDWTSTTMEYDLDVTLSALNVVLGVNTTGDYVESIIEGLGISVVGGTGVTSTPVISVNVDGYTLGALTNTAEELAVIRMPGEFKLVPGNGIDILNGNIVYDGSQVIDFEIFVKENNIPTLGLANVIDASLDGLAIRVDNITLLTDSDTSGTYLTVGLISNENLEYDYITLNGFNVELGTPFNLELNYLADVQFEGTFGPEVGQVLKWQVEGYWLAEDEGALTVTGGYGAIQYADGVGNLLSSDNLSFQDFSKELLVKGKVIAEEVKIKRGYFDDAAGDYSTRLLHAFIETTDQVHTELKVDGVIEDIYLPTNTLYSFRIKVVGFRSGGTSVYGYPGDTFVKEYLGAIKNIEGVVSLVGSITTFEIAVDEFPETWDVIISADEINTKLKIEVKGEIDTTIRWIAYLEINEISYDAAPPIIP